MDAPTSGRQRRIIAFDHIPKTGGHTVRHVLQQNFGVHHADVRQKVDASVVETVPDHTLGRSIDNLMADPPQVYGVPSIYLDDWVHLGLRSISSHAVVPFGDYGDYEQRVDWFTMLRDPERRFLSHYQMNQGSREEPKDLKEWAEALPRKNLQTFWIAGRQDLEAAKQILDEQFAAVGLVEQFDRSLLMLREFACEDWFVPSYQLEKNTARDTSLRDHVRANWGDYEDIVHEHNALDIELYEYVRDELWPRQIAEYGEAQLEADERRFFGDDPPLTARHRLNRLVNAAYRECVYNPFTKLTGR